MFQSWKCLAIGIALAIVVASAASCDHSSVKNEVGIPTSAVPGIDASREPEQPPEAAPAIVPESGSGDGLPIPSAVCVPFVEPEIEPSWPPYSPNPAWQDLVAAALARYHAREHTYTPYIQEYSATGDYLNFGATLDYHRDPTLTFDSLGIPVTTYGGRTVYNPVTVSQYALAAHGRYVLGTAEAGEFLQVVELLLTLQSEDGAFRFPFAYTYYLTGEVFQPGWVSGLAQGQSLSVFTRAYAVSGEERFLDAGEKSLEFLLRWHDDGGTMETLSVLDPSLDAYAWFKEYPSKRTAYTLNGFTFTLLGLYDWSQVPAVGSKEAAREFRCGMETLQLILPYYEVGGISAYDLGHILGATSPDIQTEYHAVHIYTVYALESVWPSAILEAQVETWRREVDGN